MFIRTLCYLVLLATMSLTAEAADVPVGRGHYTTTLRPGGEREPPPAVGRLPSLQGPVETNRWYSSLLFSTWPQPLHAHPASYRPTAEGIEIDVPVKQVVPTQRDENDIVFPHRKALVLKPLGFAMQAAKLAKASDWAIDVACGDGTDALTATFAHGSPFSWYRVTRGDVVFSGEGGMSLVSVPADRGILAFRVLGQSYAVYAPRGARWEGQGAGPWTLRLPEGQRWFTVAALPDATLGTIERFARHAYAFVTDTRVEWHYDEARSELTTTFTATLEARQGPDRGTLLGLYPHQWHANPLVRPLPALQYATVRGPLKLVDGHAFQTRYRFRGLLPHWPALSDPAAAARLKEFLAKDMAFGAEDLLARKGGTYWEGKGLNRAAQVMAIAEQAGDSASRDALLSAIRQRLQAWFAPEDGAARYFHYRSDHGTLVGYPDEFGSAEQLNDHHFHYGYWIHAAALVAMRDPQWAAHGQWGGMVELLAADIANADRQDRRFPRLRHFDAYEGHSWASGTVPFADGNNQESSSEAIHAWAGLVLWGEATGNKALRDTGIFLYTTEVEALNHYWFDLHHLVFPPEYGNTEATMVWGGKYIHTTWWTEDPREAHGINLLPLTPASTYLGEDRAYVRRNLQAMDEEFERFLARDGKAPRDIWQDILLGYLALADAPAALQQWNPEGAVEDGETRAHIWHWLNSLAELGRPHFGVTADTPLYGVFRQADGRLTYLAYNASAKPRTVRFSDGLQLAVPPRSLARAHGPAAR